MRVCVEFYFSVHELFISPPSNEPGSISMLLCLVVSCSACLEMHRNGQGNNKEAIDNK